MKKFILSLLLVTFVVSPFVSAAITADYGSSDIQNGVLNIMGVVLIAIGSMIGIVVTFYMLEVVGRRAGGALGAILSAPFTALQGITSRK